jgi:SAM-dependent methyltransferase
MTPSAPGVMTDQSAIGVVRPVQIVSDLPAVEELKQRTIEAAMAHQVPPFEIEPGPDSAEEIDPEPAARPPGPPPTSTGPAPGTDAASQRRPPPPRRGSEQALEAIEEVQPDRVSMPARQLPPPRSADQTGRQGALDAAAAGSALSTAEADFALAEARAREAEAKAREAAARAAEADAKAKAAKAAASSPPKKPWWVEMFEGDLIRALDNPRKNDVEKEASFIEQCLRLPKGSRILDLACGAGVHAVELSNRGFQVVGVDYSEKMLDLARAYNNQRGTSVSFIQGDMRKLNLEGVFDGIYCWSSSWGYFDENTNANVLERIARAVRPGGTFALDIDNRDFVSHRAPQMAWFEKPGVVCMDEMRFDYYSSRMVTRRMAIFENQPPREIETTIRLYTLRELGRLLQKVGFRILEVSGHRATRGAYFGDVSPRIIVCCQRLEED